MHSEYEFSQSLTFCWGADGMFVFSRLCKCLGETLSDILETKKRKVTISNVTDTHPPCILFIFLIFFAWSLHANMLSVHLCGDDKQVSAFLTITQTVILFMLLNLSLHIPPIYSQHSVTITPFWVCFESAQNMIMTTFLNIHVNI